MIKLISHELPKIKWKTTAPGFRYPIIELDDNNKKTWLKTSALQDELSQRTRQVYLCKYGTVVTVSSISGKGTLHQSLEDFRVIYQSYTAGNTLLSKETNSPE